MKIKLEEVLERLKEERDDKISDLIADWNDNKDQTSLEITLLTSSIGSLELFLALNEPKKIVQFVGRGERH